MSKLLFFGDAIGKPGRKALNQILPDLRKEYEPDFVVANVENLAHGKGVTLKTMQEIEGLGIDVYTSGNHVFDKREMSAEALTKYENLLRPGNYLGDLPGKGFVRIEKNGRGYLIINLNAMAWMGKLPGEVANPFLEFDRIYNEHCRPGDVVMVDFHSELTSEKKAFGFYVDGRASLVCGTHTHVPTADLRILPKGTGHVSDVGMIGAVNSVLGVPPENSIAIFLHQKFVYEVDESNPVMVNAVLAEIGPYGLATKVEKIYREIVV